MSEPDKECSNCEGTGRMMDFAFKKIGDKAAPASHVSVTFDWGDFKVQANTPEAMILLSILNELRELRKDVRAPDRDNDG